MPLAGHGAGADGAGRTPVTRLAGGEGKGVGKQEETEGYPVVGRIGVEVACGGPATEQWWRRPSGPVAAALRRRAGGGVELGRLGGRW